MDSKLKLSIYGEMFIIDLDKTLYFEADDHYTHVRTIAGLKYMMPFGLSEVIAEINRLQADEPHKPVMRLGRRFIVNTDHIFHINVVKQMVMLADNGGTIHSLQLPKPVLRELMERMQGES